MRRLGAVVALVFGLLLVWGSPKADAHALLLSSEPPAGGRVATSPSAVVLTFSEPADLSLAVIHLLDGAGESAEQGKPTVVGGDRHTLAIRVAQLANGTYTVTWRTTSSVDGHTTAGAFSFGVGVVPTPPRDAPAPKTPLPSPLSVGGRWALYLGLAALVGTLTIDVASRRQRSYAWALAAGGAVVFVVDFTRTTHSSLGGLLSTSTGTRLGVELGAVLLTGLVVLVRPRLVAVPAAVALLGRAWAGHAAASSVPLLTIGIQWLHLVAIGAWVGALPWLLLSRTKDAVGRFSRVATVALFVVIGTGTLRSIDEVGSWRGLFHTSFGVALLIKLGLVAAVITFGVWNRRRKAPRRTIVAEIVAAVAVVGVTAVLAGLAPAASVTNAARRPPPVVATGHDFATTLKVRLEVSPGTPGPNRFTVRVTDYDSGRPVIARRVSLLLAPADRAGVPAVTLPLRRAGQAWLAASPAVALPGRWRAAVTVERADGGHEVALTFGTRQPPLRVTAQRNPGLPTIYTITAGSWRVQTYIDPGSPGKNEVHFTFFDAIGDEAPTDLTSITATNGNDVERLTPRKLTRGHYVADAALHRGTWRLAFTTADGLRASFEEAIR